jgi:antitoxin (DNA-binding transcriptional repressor) of toxin-antitoxin stability system
MIGLPQAISDAILTAVKALNRVGAACVDFALDCKAQLARIGLPRSNWRDSSSPGGAMRQEEPTTHTMNISDVKNQLSRLVTDVCRHETRVVVEKSGIPVAAFISMDDLRRFVQLELERAERFAVIDRAREAFQDVPPDEIERETDRIIARDRAAEREGNDDLAAAG